MSTFIERVEQLEQHMGGPAAVARAADISPAAVYQWRTDVQPEQLKAGPLMRLQLRAGINPAWLVFGEGPMLLADAAPHLLEHPRGVEHFLEQLVTLMTAMPELQREMAIPLLSRVMVEPEKAPAAAELIRVLLQMPPKQSSNVRD